MAAREGLLPMLTWRLGDGRACKALLQPGFVGAMGRPVQSAEHRRLCVRELVNEETGLWDVNKLVQLFGNQNCMNILASVLPPRDGAGEDILIFSNSPTGKFSVKHAYKGLTQEAQGLPRDEVWKLVWRKGQILPRIRIFLWKLLYEALPLAKIIASRTSRGDPSCAVCQRSDEDVLHMLFFCPFVRACWLLGPLALRTEGLPHDLTLILKSIYNQSSEEIWTKMANTAWAIWRCRNEKTYGGQLPTIERFSNILNLVGMETRITAATNKRSSVQLNVQAVAPSVLSCKVDGSWKPPWRGGLGFVVEEGGVLKGYRAAPSKVCSPLQAEAVALRDAILFVKNQRWQSCTFYTDNQDLATVCMALHPPLEADWRAYREVNEIWKLLKENDSECEYISRSQNELADNLAKKGSSLMDEFTGYTFPTFCSN